MKVRFCCNSGANIKSTREEVVDTVKDLNLEEGEWEEMSDEEKDRMVEEWAWECLEIYFEELQ